MRRVLSWLPAVLLVPAAMAGAVAVSAPDDPTAAMRVLHPLDLGTTWVYDVTDHGKPSGTRTRQIVGQAGVGDGSLDAVALRSVYTDYPGTGRSESTAYLGLDGDRLLQHGVYSRHEYQAIEPPAPAYELPAEAGHTWAYDGAVGDTRLRIDVRLEAIEDVEVSGRTFHGCAHFRSEFLFTLDGRTSPETYEEWTCPGYGPVRIVDRVPAQGLELVEELVEFHGRAGNWWADRPGRLTTAVGPGSTPGSTLGFGPDRARSVPDGEVTPELAWSEERNTNVRFPPVGDDDLRVLAETDGTVSATDALGQVRWRIRLADPVVTTPALAGPVVLVADAEKDVWALDATDGTARWVRRLGDVVSASPAVGPTAAVVTTEDGAVTALDLATGAPVWSTGLGAPAYGAPALAGDRVVVVDRSGTVTGLDVTDGHVSWTRTLEGEPVSAPVLADGAALVADDAKVVYCWDLDDGGLRWEALTDHVPDSDLAAGAGSAVLRTSNDHVEAFRLADGDHAWTVPSPASHLAPVVVGEQVVGVSETGRVEVRDLATGAAVDHWSLPLPTPGSSIDADVPIGYVGHALVLGGDVEAEGQRTTFFAYPVDPAGARRGVAFAVDVRPVPSAAAAAPAFVDGTVLVAGQDHVLYASTGPRSVGALLESDGLLPGVVVAHGLAISQQGQEWQAVPVGGGAPAWTFPAADPLPGSLPAAGEDAVFLPVHGAGLAAVDAATGKARWYHPLPGDVGGTTPLVLPGGDVVYASGELARYDAATGAVRWTVPDVAAFSSATYDAGVVYVDAVRNQHPSGLAAYDAETGRRLWFHENQQTQIIAGPAAGEGVVVYPDAQGGVAAYDGRSGEELWRVQLDSRVAGTPLVRDGRVYVTETGHDEDLFQRGYQVVAHDLRTGVALGGFEPPGSSFGRSVPTTGSGPGGELLVPATSRLGTIVLVLEARP
ncbi:PQQ-binding-like beta-propeller repeat protein [Nocardioides aquiterrae]|uniref:Pyrrolo-quinoline quinone repeat domain-containing protein n=1 Tax=Nocardioides aquiterrae TaxID=203799 RepID=A0ABP4FCR8_9ACTN